ncbi:hypothetical protein [Albimonas pacifica]|uniref:Uncharacterized protein n=1 Tax=Albimonas pacifica TaxID=1114924 RepID=A0A1I3IKA4_9RHOB|nr:hypothetical protein [Albimonas pacifica]SFI48352.1 hypothetical protein SAMN05216258_107103 [Albimonas pacifica]
MAEADGFQPQEGEEVLWRGRPRTGFRWGLPQIASLIVGAPSLLGGLWMLAGALQAGPDLFLTLPALVASGFGGAALLAGFWYEPRRRAGTRYVLTDRRGVVIRDGPLGRRQVIAREIRADSPLDLVELGEGLGAVWFHKDRVRRAGEPGWRTVFIGFEQIEDAGRVYMILQGLRDAQAGGDGPSAAGPGA